MFKDVDTSKVETIFPILTTDEKITHNKLTYLFICVSDMKFYYIQVPLYLRNLYVPKFLCNYYII